MSAALLLLTALAVPGPAFSAQNSRVPGAPKVPAQPQAAMPLMPSKTGVPEPQFVAPVEPPSQRDGTVQYPGMVPSAKNQLEGVSTPQSAGGGAAFDGNVPPPAEDAVPGEDLTLRFSYDAKKTLMGSTLTTTIRTINGRGSQWYWEKFAKGAAVRILAGGKTRFSSRVADAYNKKISDLTKSDFAGYYSPRVVQNNSVGALRKKLVKDLDEYARRSFKRPVTVSSEVRVIRFLSFKQSQDLPENKAEILPPQQRKNFDIPAPLVRQYRYLPKAVVIDTRLMPEGASYGLIEDLSKLTNAGVFVIALSDKREGEAGSAEDILTKTLTPQQRDKLKRYKLITLTDGGNRLTRYKGPFASGLPMRSFPGQQLEIMAHIAASLGAKVLRSHAYDFTVQLPKDASTVAFSRSFEKAADDFALEVKPRNVLFGEQDGQPTVAFRPNTLETAVPEVLETLRDRMGLFVTPGELMVLSKDEGVLKAFDGAIQPSKLAPELGGQDLVDMSLASLLGPYRNNKEADLATSYSMLEHSDEDSGGGGGGSRRESIYMMLGHVIHSAFNWAVWNYRTTGVFPGADELVARGVRNWELADAERKEIDGLWGGASMADFQAVMQTRLRSMHAATAELLKRYPIVIGTELPSLYVVPRYKWAHFHYRDIFRLVYDLVVARETPDGLDLRVADFKTGQTPTMENLEKDTQVQLYSSVVRDYWDRVPVPYSTGDLQKVARTGLIFIYSNVALEPMPSEWSRIKFEKRLRSATAKLRKKFHIDLPVVRKEKTPGSRPRTSSKKTSKKGKKAAKKSGKKSGRKA